MPKPPLQGLRIIDISNVFSLPYAGGLLADLGAEVIKIEGPGRLDVTRQGAFSGLHPDNEPGPDPWNRCGTFNLLNRGKKSLAVDLSRPEGREILQDLIRVSDVLMENFTPRVMRNWALDYPNARKLKPDLVMVSCSGYGHEGPYSQYPAHATTQEATHGLPSVTGYRGDVPSKAGQSFVDFLASWSLVIGTLLGLRYRHRCGKGLWVDVAMYQLGCAMLSEHILDWRANGRLPERIGDRHPWCAPQGCYPCAGKDQWCVLCVRDDEEWAALCRVMGRPELGGEQRFAANAGRIARHDEIDALIAAWTASLPKFEVMERLQEMGVPAGAVFDARDLHLDRHLRSRRFLEWVEFPPERGIGKRQIIGRPWRLSETPLQVRDGAPALGQNNREVLQKILGYGEARIAELEEAGIVGDRPTKARPLVHMEMDERVRQGLLAYWDPDFKARLGIEEEHANDDGGDASGEMPVKSTMTSMIPEETQQAMRKAGFWPDRLITDYLDRHIKERPEGIAIVDQNSMTGERNALSYAELGRRVDRLAGGLAALGVRRGDVVSYQLPNWWQFTALHLAAMRLGAVTNPLMPIFRERELSFMLSLIESKVFVVPRSFRGFDYAAMALGLKPQLPALERVLVVGGEGEEAFERLLDAPSLAMGPPPGADDVIEVQFTSGTTGEPKGVMHTSNTLLSAILPYAERLGLGQSDVVLMASPMAHQTGFLYGLMMPIVLGAKAVLQDQWSPQRAAELVAGERVTFSMAATPFLADLTAEAERRPEDFASLRIFLSAGAPIPRVLVRRAAQNMGAAIISAWGMTENGAVTTTRPEDPAEKVFETDGCALPGMEIRIVDEQRRLLPPGAEGRLEVRTCSNFAGYLKRPEWYTIDAEGWFDSGDLARMDAEGYVRLTGRTKDIIIRGGENIPVVEVEGLIYQHPAVVEAAIVAMPDPRLGERACAFVVTREGQRLSLAELTEFLLKQKIAKPYLPERLEILPSLPKTPSGKIQKFRLREIASRFAATARLSEP